MACLTCVTAGLPHPGACLHAAYSLWRCKQAVMVVEAVMFDGVLTRIMYNHAHVAATIALVARDWEMFTGCNALCLLRKAHLPFAALTIRRFMCILHLPVAYVL